MILRYSYSTSILLLAIILSLPAYGQTADSTKIINSVFPDSWDKNRELRKRNGKVLLWKHEKKGKDFERRTCITLVCGKDSSGKAAYFISEMYSDKKRFNKWHYGFIYYYPNYFSDSATGIKIGYYDVHLERYDHQPTEKELYTLLQKWNYSFFEEGSITIAAGSDDKLWLETFGYIPARKNLLRIK